MLLCRFSKNDNIVEMVQLIIGRGAQVNLTDEWGKTAGDLLDQNSSVSQDKKQMMLQLLPKSLPQFDRNQHKGIDKKVFLFVLFCGFFVAFFFTLKPFS